MGQWREKKKGKEGRKGGRKEKGKKEGGRMEGRRKFFKVLCLLWGILRLARSEFKGKDQLSLKMAPVLTGTLDKKMF